MCRAWLSHTRTLFRTRSSHVSTHYSRWLGFCLWEMPLIVVFLSAREQKREEAACPKIKVKLELQFLAQRIYSTLQQAHETSPCVGWLIPSKVIGAVGQGWPLVCHCCPVGHTTRATATWLCLERIWEHPWEPNGVSVMRPLTPLFLALRCFWSQEGEQPLKEKKSVFLFS